MWPIIFLTSSVVNPNANSIEKEKLSYQYTKNRLLLIAFYS